MPAHDRQNKPQDPEQEKKDLSQLLGLLNTPANKQQLPSLRNVGKGVNSPRQPRPTELLPQSSRNQLPSTEARQLDNFSLQYQGERDFSNHVHHKLFCDIFSGLTKHRLCSKDWLNKTSPENVLRVLVCLRVLMRDGHFQKLFFTLGGVKFLSEHFQSITQSYLKSSDGPYSRDILKEMTNMFQKLSSVEEQREWLVACDAHKSLVLLLSATDVFVLHCCLHALIGLAQSSRPRQLIGELNSIHVLLMIIQEYDTISKKLAANLLRLLCVAPQSRETIKSYDGIPVLLSQLHGDNAHLLYHMVWCLVQLCEDDPDTSAVMRQMGAIPLLLALLQEQKFVSERTEASSAVSSAGTNGRTFSQEDEELLEDQYQLKSACCAALMELVMNDYTNAQQIVQSNGMYVLGMLVLPPESTQVVRDSGKKLFKKLQMNAFRTLRFLFSMERNRRFFKQLFPADLFEMFIDVGHYNKDLKAYKQVAEKINSFSVDVIDEIREHIQGINQSKIPNHYIGDYAVFELLGTGAFGSVHKVRRRTARQSFLAMKEVNLQNAAFGKNAREKQQSVGEITNELRIMKESLRHPNIVRYHRTFEENDKLYIVMELIEGATLADHFNSLKEKKSHFEEHRIWNIFLQMTLALRYLHKEKGIVHRDLTPNNIMLGQNDKVTITDFGLAKQKRSDCSKMMSIVGTILYSCPEIVQNQPYGEKADIWALGCILYQMAVLDPPFFSNNMLTLVKKIVAAEYAPITEDIYSKRLIDTVKSCLTVAPEERPDILELCAGLTDLLLVYIDNLHISQNSLQRKLDRERKRTQKHFVEANQHMQSYHRLFLASQNSYERLKSLSGSDGAEGFREVQETDGVFVDPVGTSNALSPPGDAVPVSARGVSISLSSILFQADDRGGTTDEESYPSSGSESRESSAGSVRSLNPTVPQHPLPSTPKVLRDARRRATKRCGISSLMVDIPQAAKTSRDSGLSSGDPSPNTSQSPSTGQSPTSNMVFDQLLTTRLEGVGGLRHHIHRSQSSDPLALTARAPKRLEARSKSAAMLTISPNRLREISDPILQMLHQLHKMVYITQLPPTLEPNPHRHMIEQYKRALFCQGSTAVNLKSELRKLSQGSREIIDLDLTLPDVSRRLTSRDHDARVFDPDKPVTGEYDPDYKDVGITYEHMHSVIEDTLIESGYYDMHTVQNDNLKLKSHNGAREKILPQNSPT
ncbi:serine/threonine-protein kinase Nek10-like [Babylonia areolata]|uniref:serine/threonine-protein kinase Nek10-like n=1 Tax=Babylonia areolata TaxID=304850 RepID=UPI003FCF5F2B